MTNLSTNPPPPKIPQNSEKKILKNASIPPIPKREKHLKKKEKKKQESASLIFKPQSETENLYWKLAWLQFIIISLGYWAALIQSYNVDIAKVSGFWAGVGSTNLKVAIYGTVSSFSNVVIGGIMKLYNQRIDLKQRREEISKLKADQEEREKNMLEDLNKKKDKRILDLETHLLNLNMKMASFKESQMKISK